MKKIVCTLGDPNSIGPEVAQQAITQFLKNATESFSIVVVGPKKCLAPEFLASAQLELLDSEREFEFKPGLPSISAAKRSFEDLKLAAQYCLEKNIKALVTGPVHKALIAKSEPGFRGQTGLLQDMTGAASATMMLAGPSLKVALVTTHIALHEVAHSISQEKIEICIRDTFTYLSQHKIPVRLGVLGLNPHASDNGLMGNQESEIIEPVIQKMQSPQLILSGPLSPDTAFLHRDRFDAFICMYHDQALIPLKLLDFDQAVNLSLGLPFLRCSVDHGTAFDIAGQNRASYSSYEQALRIAALGCSPD